VQIYFVNKTSHKDWPGFNQGFIQGRKLAADYLTVSSDYRRYVFSHPKCASWRRYLVTLQKCLKFHFSNISQTAQKPQFQNKKWTNYLPYQELYGPLNQPQFPVYVFVSSRHKLENKATAAVTHTCISDTQNSAAHYRNSAHRSREVNSANPSSHQAHYFAQVNICRVVTLDQFSFICSLFHRIIVYVI